jgi:RNA polymerase sigma-54 factor
MLKPALHLKLGQQLTMTPQLQQAIKLLQLPVLELQAQVMAALETNVMLEQEEDDTIDLASLDQVTPTGEVETASAENGEADEPTADDVIVEMEDPWAESSTTTARSNSPMNAAATCTSTWSGSWKSARSTRARCGSARRSSTR